MLELALANRFPMVFWWGPRLVQFYNDPYRPILGEKHPRSLGQGARECWGEIWDVIGPQIESVYATGISTWNEDLLLQMNRYGFTEDTFFTFSYSPLPDPDVADGIGGVLATVQETTAKVLGERRINLLRDLAVRSSGARSVRDECVVSIETIKRYPHSIPFAMIYELSEDERTASLVAHSSDVVERYHGVRIDEVCTEADPMETVRQAVRLRQTVVMPDAAALLACAPDGDDGALTRAVVVPITGANDRIVGLLVAAVNPRLHFDDQYQGFYGLVGAQISTAIVRAMEFEAERKRIEVLAELDRAKNTFFSNVSHEFRTPLTLMLGPLEELLRVPDPSIHEIASTARRNALRLLKLVNTLLDFSRLESGKHDAFFLKTDLASLTRDLASTFRSVIEASGLAFNVEVDLSEPAYVDRSMWERIVLNLLSNAYKFTLEGSITVSVRERNGYAELSVTDTGSGIPASELPHLFERFRRVRTARSRSIEGSGIGLALVHELVEIHGGTIEVESTEGRGSMFTVRLPLGSAHLDAAAIASDTLDDYEYTSASAQYAAEFATMAPSGSGESARNNTYDAGIPRILVADDNADLRAYLVRILNPLYDVIAVSNGAEALDVLAHRTIDAIVSDVMMPDVDGFELLRAVRANARLRSIPFLMLSARAGEEATVDGLNAGADDYLVKPFLADELLARVRSQLAASAIRNHVPGQWFDRPGDGLGNERAFRVFANALPIMVWQQDVTGAVSFANAAWFETLHLPREATSLTIDAWKHVIHPDDLELTLGTIEKAIEPRAEFALEYRLKPADADERAYRWYLARALPQFDEAKHFRGWIGTIIDVHDAHVRADVERKLREVATNSERDLRALAEAIPVIVWTADAQGYISWYNRGWYDYTGQTPDQAAGWGWQAAHHPDDLPTVIERWASSIATGQPFEMEFRLRRSDGVFHTFLTRIRPIRNDAGDIVKWYGSNVDIQAQKEVLERSQHVSQTLQRMFLPEELPHSDVLRADAVYQAADEDALIGGDWFDALPLKDGRLLLSIGDVTGHGLLASTIAGRLRNAIRDFSLVCDDPADVLRHANSVMLVEHPSIYATAIVAFVDASLNTLRYACAGHHSPLLARRSTQTAEILPYGGLMLGLADDMRIQTHETQIARGDVLALYTDGLVEFNRDIDAAEATLRAAMLSVMNEPGVRRPAAAIREAVLQGSATVDDAALMVVQFSNEISEASDQEEAPRELTWRFHSSDASMAHMSRLEIMTFVKSMTMDSHVTFNAELILGELLANAVQHAPGLVEIHLRWTDEEAALTFRDSGPGMPDRRPALPTDALQEKGRGLFLIEMLAREVQIIDTGSDGTTIRVTLDTTPEGG